MAKSTNEVLVITGANRPLFSPMATIIILILVGIIGGIVLALSRFGSPFSVVQRETQPIFERAALLDMNVINSHEHLYKLEHLTNYLEAAKRMGVDRTIFVASSSATFLGNQGKQDEFYDWNVREILTAAKKYPEKVIPFCTIYPNDPEKLAKLKQYVADGAQGLKLYSGHSNFYDKPLNAPDMLPIYAYCQEINLPICWHIRLGRFQNDFVKVMESFPNLTVIIPHFGVTFFRPTSEFRELPGLLDRYPNLYFDTSFGTRAILVHGLEIVSDNRDIFREFFLDYSDRIVFGTDMVVTGNSEKTIEWEEAVIRACRDVLEKHRYHFYMAAKGSPYALAQAENTYGELIGLNLPEEVLVKVYKTNIETILGRLITD